MTTWMLSNNVVTITFEIKLTEFICMSTEPLPIDHIQTLSSQLVFLSQNSIITRGPPNFPYTWYAIISCVFFKFNKLRVIKMRCTNIICNFSQLLAHVSYFKLDTAYCFLMNNAMKMLKVSISPSVLFSFNFVATPLRSQVTAGTPPVAGQKGFLTKFYYYG